MTGWVKVHRKLLDWGWFSDSHMVHLFIYFLLEANHEKRMWKGVEILPGQLIFGRKAASETLGISEQSIRTCITRLKSTNEITIKSTSKFSVITLVNWENYQGDEKKSTSKSTNKLTNDQPATNQQLTTPKECKEDTTNVVSIHPLCAWIKEKLPSVSKMKEQLTDHDAENLVNDFDKKLLRDILERMENWVPLLKKNKSVNKTVRNWIAKEVKDKGINAKPKQGKSDYSAHSDFYDAYQNPNLKAV